MKKLLALAALVTATSALLFVLARTGDVTDEDSQAAALRVPGERAERRATPSAGGPDATELVPIPEPAPDADYDPSKVEAELDAIEHTSVRTPVESFAPAALEETPRLVELSFEGESFSFDKNLILQDLRIDASSSVTVMWGQIGSNGLIVSTPQPPHDGLHSTEHAPGVPASQGYVAGGLKTGLWTTWHAGAPNGDADEGTASNKESEGHYAYDQKHGTWTQWYASGQVRNEGEFLYGKQEGPWVDFHPDGSKAETATYVNGRRDGRVTSWHPGGARKSEAFYSFGRLHLEHREWRADGERASKGTFEYGKRVGRWRYWNADGTPDEERSGIYAGGSKVND